MTSTLVLLAATVAIVASVASVLVYRSRSAHHVSQSAVYDRDTL